MQHLNEEEMVLHHFGDDASPAAASRHLDECAACREQYETITRVLALIDDAPVPDRPETYGSEVWNRLRWKLGRERRNRRRTWISALAAAAVLAVVFFAGQLWHARQLASTQTTQVAAAQSRPAATQQAAAQPAATSSAQQNQRVLVLVVGDHLDSSERMLVELANADPKKGFDVTAQSRQAGELVASNRIYRQTASRRGETQIASLLSDIEPLLVELSHAHGTLTREELTSMQHRIESKGLLFKVRVVSAQMSDDAAAAQASTSARPTNSL